ncbi:MAG: hypothetical protein JRF35_12460 [Deltaproteobacteria bacterium]|nr:hypothetical protein [Deltaproteobacteria bacterium]
MERALFNSWGEPVAYISNDRKKIIFLWDGHPVAYLYGHHVYGFNGLHLGWFINGVVYDAEGNRIGFTSTTCPLPAAQEPPKAKKYAVAKMESRQEAPPLPDLGFNLSEENFEDFLKAGYLGLEVKLGS